MEHEVCLSLQVQDPGKHQHLMLGASVHPLPRAQPGGPGGPGAECCSRRSLRAQQAGASFCGKPLGERPRRRRRRRRGRSLTVGGGLGGRTREPPSRAAQPETFSQTSGGGLAARSAGAAQRELGDSASRGGRVAHARAGLLVGTRSPCGSARAAATKMPSLRPVALRALLWLWLCGAGPARGEYRAPGTPSLCLRGPRAAPSKLPRPGLESRRRVASPVPRLRGPGRAASGPRCECGREGGRGLRRPVSDTRIGPSVPRRSWAWGSGLGEVEAAVGELVWQRAEPHD